MSMWDNLRQATTYLRKLRLSRGRDSYYRYKLKRDYERKEADRFDDSATASAGLEREKAERAREYDSRYARGREGDIPPERANEEKRPGS
jgi:hypothetical protein